MDPVSLTAGRLHLRPFEPGDAPEVLEACSDREVSRWTTVPWPYTAEHARAYVEEVSPAGWADGTAASFAVLDATTARLLASVGLRLHGPSATLGYWTAREARRQGVTAEAVGVVCRWGFGALGLRRIGWEAHVGNWGSRAVAESCGFTVEGTLRLGLPQDGGLVDSWTGSLLATDEVRDRRAFGRWRELSGQGLVLRRWRPDDLDALVTGLSDPETARWTPVPVPYGREQGRQWLERTEPQQWAEGVAASLAVEQDGAVVGLVVLIPSTRDPGAAEIGWWTLPSARGCGVAGRAVRLLAPWAAGLGRVRLEALVDPGNLASQRVAERAGMVAEGLRRGGLRPLRGGPRGDALVYALLDGAAAAT